VRLLGSGAILREVIAAAALLAEQFHVSSEIWSVTSFSELAREAAEVARWNRLHPRERPRESHLEQCLPGDLPIIAASDYVRAYPQLIGPYLGAGLTVLGTDGFGRSDTRSALRRFFEVDREHIVVAALHAAARRGDVDRVSVASAIERFGIETELAAPGLVSGGAGRLRRLEQAVHAEGHILDGSIDEEAGSAANAAVAAALGVLANTLQVDVIVEFGRVAAMSSCRRSA